MSKQCIWRYPLLSPDAVVSYSIPYWLSYRPPRPGELSGGPRPVKGRIPLLLLGEPLRGDLRHFFPASMTVKKLPEKASP